MEKIIFLCHTLQKLVAPLVVTRARKIAAATATFLTILTFVLTSFQVPPFSTSPQAPPPILTEAAEVPMFIADLPYKAKSAIPGIDTIEFKDDVSRESFKAFVGVRKERSPRAFEHAANNLNWVLTDGESSLDPRMYSLLLTVRGDHRLYHGKIDLALEDLEAAYSLDSSNVWAATWLLSACYLKDQELREQALPWDNETQRQLQDLGGKMRHLLDSLRSHVQVGALAWEDVVEVMPRLASSWDEVAAVPCEEIELGAAEMRVCTVTVELPDFDPFAFASRLLGLSVPRDERSQSFVAETDQPVLHLATHALYIAGKPGLSGMNTGGGRVGGDVSGCSPAAGAGHSAGKGASCIGRPGGSAVHATEQERLGGFGEEVAARRRALVVGVDRYGAAGDTAGDRESFADLDHAERDAQRMATVLADRSYGVRTLLGDQVKPDAVIVELAKEVLLSREGDKLLVYLSLHGFTDPDGNAYLATAGGDTGNGFLSLGDVRTLLSYHRGDVVVLVDGCLDERKVIGAPDGGGWLAESGLFRALGAGGPDGGLAAVDDDGSVFSGPRIYVASSPGGVAIESTRLQSGLFTHTLLRFLESADDDQDLFADFAEMVADTSAETRRLARTLYGVEQRPRLLP